MYCRGVKLFSITASPSGSNDESFESQQGEFPLGSHPNHHLASDQRSDSSDSGLEDHCRTSTELDASYDQVSVRQHGYQSSSASDSIFHSTEESFGNMSSFAIKPLRPISGVSVVSSSEDSGELNEDDTFAFKRNVAPSPFALTLRVLTLAQQQRARPASILSNESSLLGPDDTFGFKKQQSRAPPLPFSLPKLLPNERRRAPPTPISPVCIKRKAVPRQDELSESPRKARLVDGSERAAAAAVERTSAETLRSFKMPTKGIQERPSLEKSCLEGAGEDLSFSSQGLSRPSLFLLLARGP